MGAIVGGGSCVRPFRSLPLEEGRARLPLPLGEGWGEGITQHTLRIASSLTRRAVAALLCLALAGCVLPGRPAAPSPLDGARRWGEQVRSYRYERTTVTALEGRSTVVHEEGEVVLPDRQRIRLRSVSGGEGGGEVIIVGARAWVSPPIAGRGWEESRSDSLPPDPLTIALASLAVAGPISNIGERRDPGDRYCQGWAYAFDPARVSGWPAAAVPGAVAAEATVWLLPDGAICGHTVRLQRDGRPDAEYSARFFDVNAPLVIQAPA